MNNTRKSAVQEALKKGQHLEEKLHSQLQGVVDTLQEGYNNGESKRSLAEMEREETLKRRKRRVDK